MPRIAGHYVGFGVRTAVDAWVRERFRRRVAASGQAPTVVRAGDGEATAVDEYWNRHALHKHAFLSASESEAYLRRRNSDYPLFTELMELYVDHTGETILDYGCGPGDDLIGFLLYSNASRVIGMDISAKALGFAGHRVALHKIASARVQLLQITDAAGLIPLDDASVNYVLCGGVLHHSSHPAEILREFNRVLKPGGRACLMLYNRDSVMYHVWIAYAQLIRNDAFPGLTVDDAFTRSTDGPDCPISIAYSPDRVLEMCRTAGFDAQFAGGYLSVLELEWLAKYGVEANKEPRLAAEHRAFVQALERDSRGLPTYRGKPAGIGGVYRLSKRGAQPGR